MKMILLWLLVTYSLPTMADTCWNRVYNAMSYTSGTPNKVLAKYMCVGIEDPAMLERAVIIAKLESDFQNVISAGGDDFTHFQFHIDTIKSYGLDKRYLMLNMFYQFDSFTRIMNDKLQACKLRAVPEACWHSATDKHYQRYSKKYLEIQKKVRRFL